MLTLGIDEAGRGPVVGPLIICGAVFDERGLAKLKALQVKDSKMHSPAQRRRLKAEIEKLAKFVVIERLEPWEIDQKRSDGTNLNRLETLKFIAAINKTFESIQINRVVIDVPDPNLKKYKAMITNLIKRDNLEIVAEHRADEKYIECSAASIIAKVTRDSEIDELKKEYGDFGAGYPSDPKCIEWLKNWLKTHKKFPKIVRHSWETISDLVDKKEQTKIGDFRKKT